MSRKPQLWEATRFGCAYIYRGNHTVCILESRLRRQGRARRAGTRALQIPPNVTYATPPGTPRGRTPTCTHRLLTWRVPPPRRPELGEQGLGPGWGRLRAWAPPSPVPACHLSRDSGRSGAQLPRELVGMPAPSLMSPMTERKFRRAAARRRNTPASRQRAVSAQARRPLS